MSDPCLDRDIIERVARLEERSGALDRLLSEREKRADIVFALSEKAIDKAEDAQLRVNTTQNEFRGALKDQAATLTPQAETDRILERVQALEKAISFGGGRAGGIGAAQSLLFNILPLIVSAVAIVAAFWKQGQP